MNWLAIIDATGHTDAAPPRRVVAGLSLIERALRLAGVSGCGRAVVVAESRYSGEVRALVETADIDTEFHAVDSSGCAAVIDAAAADIDAVDDAVGEAIEAVLMLDSSVVYDRRLIHAWQNDAGDPDALGLFGASTVDATPADLLEFSLDRWPQVVAAAKPAGAATIADLAESTGAELTRTDGCQSRVHDDTSADRGASMLWDGCRKSVDGLVSRHLNRHISLAISRRIASTGIHPNHISVVTFGLGAAAAVLAASGGYIGFLLAGLAYQLNSIIDGVDGELARVKYDFSLLGEWLDTLSDDTKDVLFYAGLAIGAWRTTTFPVAGVDATSWLWLGGIAVVGKLGSMAAYYSWLIAHGRGDLLAFDWSFEDQQAQPSQLNRALAGLKYLAKNDFVVFLAMLMAIAGLLPFFLMIAAPGQFLVAGSVIVQRIQRARSIE